MQQAGTVDQVWTAMYGAVAEALTKALTPETLLVLACGFALTHWFKVGLELYVTARGVCVFEDEAMHQRAWRFVVMTATMVLYGLCAWVWSIFGVIQPMATPAIAILAPVLWRVLVWCPVPMMRRLLTTPMDRKLLKY